MLAAGRPGGRADHAGGYLHRRVQRSYERATDIAHKMVTKYGMSEEVGPVVFGTDHDEVFLGRDFSSTPRYSEEVAARIDEEVKHIIDEAYQRCESILRSHIDKLHEVARALFEREKVDADEFKAIMENPSLPQGAQS